MASPPYDVQQAVRRAIDDYQARTDAHIADEAVETLLKHAAQHKGDLVDLLRAGKLTADQLRTDVMQLLDAAAQRGAAAERDRPAGFRYEPHIDAAAMAAALRLDCKSFPWC